MTPAALSWRRLRQRINNQTITDTQYAELEPHLTRPLTDDPIRRRNPHPKPTPKEPTR